MKNYYNVFNEQLILTRTVLEGTRVSFYAVPSTVCAAILGCRMGAGARSGYVT